MFPAQSLANHLGMFSLQPGSVPTHCMLDLPFLKDFGLLCFVPNLLHPHNRTSHFHLAFKTSFALLGGRFRSSVMACKQIRCISTFLLSVRATQTREIWRVEAFSNLLPVAGWKPFQVGFQLWKVTSLWRSHQGLFLLNNEKGCDFHPQFWAMFSTTSSAFFQLFCLLNLLVKICFKI